MDIIMRPQSPSPPLSEVHRPAASQAAGIGPRYMDGRKGGQAEERLFMRRFHSLPASPSVVRAQRLRSATEEPCPVAQDQLQSKSLHQLRPLMEQNLQHTIALLSRTPAALNALLRDLPEAWTRQNEGENTMSPFDVVGHLIHAEHADWVPRITTILQFGETRTFEPFDRQGHADEIQGKTLGQLLDEFGPACARKTWTSFAP